MPDGYHQTHYFVSGKSPDDPDKKMMTAPRANRSPPGAPRIWAWMPARLAHRARGGRWNASISPLAKSCANLSPARPPTRWLAIWPGVYSRRKYCERAKRNSRHRGSGRWRSNGAVPRNAGTGTAPSGGMDAKADGTRRPLAARGHFGRAYHHGRRPCAPSIVSVGHDARHRLRRAGRLSRAVCTRRGPVMAAPRGRWCRSRPNRRF